VNESENAAGEAARSAIPSPDEARDWLNKHLARAPERDEQWYRDVLNIYRAGHRPLPDKAQSA
jgi:hypothetical protein